MPSKRDQGRHTAKYKLDRNPHHPFVVWLREQGRLDDYIEFEGELAHLGIKA